MDKLFEVIDVAEGPNIRIEVLQYRTLEHTGYFYEQRSGVRLKQVRITLNQGKVVTEAGALHFLKGHVTAENRIGKGFMQRMASSMLTDESFARPEYTGTGEVYLEPSFDHFLILKIENDDIIVDKGLFYCCEPTIDVGVYRQKHLSAAIKGGEGWFQTRLTGTGICVLKTSVPAEEIIQLELNNERLQVDGNFALLRTGNISFTVEKSAKSILGSITSGDGLLQTFSGTGQVWLAPTEFLYKGFPTKTT